MIYFSLDDEVISIDEQILIKDKFISYRLGIDLKNKKMLIRRANITENYSDEENRKTYNLTIKGEEL